jgi:hypothetical protein
MFLLFPGFHVFGDSTDIFSIIISDNSGISMTLLNTSFNSSISSIDNSDLGNLSFAKVFIKYPFPDPEGPFIIHIIFALTAKRRKIAASL